MLRITPSRLKSADHLVGERTERRDAGRSDGGPFGSMAVRPLSEGISAFRELPPRFGSEYAGMSKRDGTLARCAETHVPTGALQTISKDPLLAPIGADNEMKSSAVTVAAGRGSQIDLTRTQAIDQARHAARLASIDPTVDPTICVRPSD